MEIKSQTSTNYNSLNSKTELVQAKHEKQQKDVIQFAKNNNLDIRFDTNQQTLEMQYVLNGFPQYYVTHNYWSSKTISTNEVYSSGNLGLNLTGTGILLRMWDAGSVRQFHQEFGQRVSMGDFSFYHTHATHVAGTLIASGVDPFAKGMAYDANLISYNWNNDEWEMMQEAMDSVLISNHSYGFTRGWNNGIWYGNFNISTQEDYLFGFYDENTQLWDQIAFDAPYYLICKSAGNDRFECGNNSYPCDGAPDGYDCISQLGVAKNILTIGAVEDMPTGYNDTSGVVMTSFSSWGPADDGRIKPDICANGTEVFSSDSEDDDSYVTYSGTSMASPSVAGSLAVLQQHYSNLNGTGNYLKAATLKALVIHTADEAGTFPGPDYKFGWGVMNTAKAAEKISQDQNEDVISEFVLMQDSTYTTQITASGNTPLKVTMVWTDPPGIPVPAQLDPTVPMLVNNLDIKLTDSLSSYYPWRLDRDNPSAQAVCDAENNVDNVEVIYIQNPVAGTHTLTVDHNGMLENGEQAFSIIISGIDEELSPIADFKTNKVYQYPGGEIRLYDKSKHAPASRLWSFSGPGNVTFLQGTSPTSQNPIVKFDVTGDYDVMLSVMNEYGNDTAVKAAYLHIDSDIYCPSSSIVTDQHWISKVVLNKAIYNSGASNGYEDHTNPPVNIEKGKSYVLAVHADSLNPYRIEVFIDWNEDLDFEDSLEYQYHVLPVVGSVYFNIEAPSFVDPGIKRMRIVANKHYNFINNPCTYYNYGETEDYSLNVLLFQPDEQSVGFNSGWNISSFNVIPDCVNMYYVLEPLIDSMNLIKVIDEQGEFLQNIPGIGWINTIGDMENTEGYHVKVTNDQQVTNEGEFIVPPFPVTLQEGWNIMGMPLSDSVNAIDLLQPLLDSALLVKVLDESGGIIQYIPGTGWLNTIEYLHAGKGYYVKVNDDCQLFCMDLPWTCGDILLDNRDMQRYQTVQIGNQCWMAENLNAGSFVSSFDDQQDNGIIEKYCPTNNIDSCTKYGGLYQWDEMMQYSDSATQGICPDGWHIPSDDEWKILEGNVDSHFPVDHSEWDNLDYRGHDAGVNLITRQNNPNHGADLYGFNSLIPGMRLFNGEFWNGIATYWTRTLDVESDIPMFRRMTRGDEFVYRQRLYSVVFGMSLRCIQD